MTAGIRPDPSAPHRTGNVGDDLRGVGKLAIDATTSITSLVEAMHGGIKRPLRKGAARTLVRAALPASCIAAFAASREALVLHRRRAALLSPALRDVPDVRGRDSILSIVNGVMGDYLQQSGNPLAIDMEWRVGGRRLEITPDAIRLQHRRRQRQAADHGAWPVHERSALAAQQRGWPA